MKKAPGNTGKKDAIHPTLAHGIHTYRYGDEIVREGDENESFYVILDGHVRISRQGKKIRQIKAQDIFGLEHILLKRPSPYTARAMDHARIASYGPDALDHFVRNNPRMTQMILSSTMQQLTATTLNFSQEIDVFPMDGVRVSFYTDGQVLVEEGVIHHEFFRLISTQKGLLVTEGGKELRMIRKPGEFFGELAGILETPSPVKVTSVGESVVEAYAVADMDIIAREYPETALHAMNVLISHFHTAGKHPAGIDGIE